MKTMQELTAAWEQSKEYSSSREEFIMWAMKHAHGEDLFFQLVEESLAI